MIQSDIVKIPFRIKHIGKILPFVQEVHDIMATPQQIYEKLSEQIKAAQHCVAFTGAGVSTLSGIRDFRGKNGLYTLPETDQMFDIDVFRQNPSVYYRLAKDFIYGLQDKEPSIVHHVLANLETQGKLKALITQNIDLLHQKAGSKHVIEVHGSPIQHSCTYCSYTTTFEAIVDTARTGAVPYCPQCSHALKPDITFFGEALPLAAITEAQKECAQADLLLVLGSSLTVYPAAALPQITLQAGGAVIIINEQPTYFDSHAILRCTDLQESFDYLKKAFKI